MTTNSTPTGDRKKHSSATSRAFRRFLDFASLYLLLRQLVAWLGHAMMSVDPSCGSQVADLGAAILALVQALPSPPLV